MARKQDESSQDESTTQEETVVDDGLVAMIKNGEEMRVHPSCVKAHEELKWVVVGS